MTISDATNNILIQFRTRYYHEPELFVREVLGGDPDKVQVEIMVAVARGEKRIAVRSGHRVGKSTTLAWLTLWWIFTRFPQKTIATAPTEKQLFGALVAETKTWFSKLPEPLQECFDVQSEKIIFLPAPSESYVEYNTSRPDKPEALAGKHSANVLLIADEASGIPEQVYESAIGSMAGEHSQMLMTGNPVRSTGFFYNAFHKAKSLWKRFHISGENHPRVDKDFVRMVRDTYGELSNAYRVRVKGDFPLADDDTVIPADLVDAALNREVTAIDVQEIWGLDVARFGNDATALARRKGNVLVCPVEEKRGYDTMQTVGWVKAKWDNTPIVSRPSQINVDVIGIGAGVLDRLVELGLPAFGINVSESPALYEERYVNMRAELWFTGKEWLEKRDCSLQGDEDLAYELKMPTYTPTSSGKMQVESKEAMKKRGEKSPNRADAFLLTLATEAITASGSSKKKASWKTALKRKIGGL